jgi:antitoxin (DNA-binding transcriptional repressor) of toxin-antitoxin stability system
MKTATVADLRNNFRRISGWIEHGETVQIIKRGRAFASLSAIPVGDSYGAAAKPDIMAQLRQVWGDKMFSMAEVAAMREAERAIDER